MCSLYIRLDWITELYYLLMIYTLQKVEHIAQELISDIL